MSEYAIAALSTTITVACLSLSIVLVTGIPAAYLVGNVRAPLTRWIDAFMLAPLVLPPTVVGFALLWLLGRQGPVGEVLYSWFGYSPVFTKGGAVIAAAVVSFPLLYRSARAAFASVDTELLDASRTLGKSELATFLLISLPLAKRGIIAGALLALVRAMGEFGATMMVAGNISGSTQTLPLAIFEAVQSGRDSDALILCLLATVAALLVVLLAEKVMGGAR